MRLRPPEVVRAIVDYWASQHKGRPKKTAHSTARANYKTTIKNKIVVMYQLQLGRTKTTKTVVKITAEASPTPA